MAGRVRFLLVAVAILALAATGTTVTLDHSDDPDAKSDQSRTAVPGAAPRPDVAPVLRRDGRKRRVQGAFGVASANAFANLDLVPARADWDRLTGRRTIDLIGWQESKSPEFRELYPQYRQQGWETWFWSDVDTGPTSSGPATTTSTTPTTPPPVRPAASATASRASPARRTTCSG